MIYFDCSCQHNLWQGFESLEKAIKFYNSQPCEKKILYEETSTTEMKVIKVKE